MAGKHRERQPGGLFWGMGVISEGLWGKGYLNILVPLNHAFEVLFRMHKNKHKYISTLAKVGNKKCSKKTNK